jgi:hypothetical protein
MYCTMDKLTHPTLSRFSKSGWGYRLDGQAVQGITDIIERLWFPGFRNPRSKGTPAISSRRKGKALDRAVTRMVDHEYSGRHPLLSRYQADLKTLGLKLIASQFLVGDPSLRLATEIDDVAVDEKGVYYCIEVECVLL